MKTTKLFVYGTLKTGFGNNHYLRGGALLGRAKLRGYGLFLIGGVIPMVAKDADHYVLGELWQIPTSYLIGLDRLEHGYQRRTEAVLLNNEFVDAQVYCSVEKNLDSVRTCGVLVETGMYRGAEPIKRKNQS
jgi:gamma-glutamylcyclotransferase (GGCT)/AIG2-like uncharacterized protein YtfP